MLASIFSFDLFVDIELEIFYSAYIAVELKWKISGHRIELYSKCTVRQCCLPHLSGSTRLNILDNRKVFIQSFFYTIFAWVDIMISIRFSFQLQLEMLANHGQLINLDQTVTADKRSGLGGRRVEMIFIFLAWKQTFGLITLWEQTPSWLTVLQSPREYWVTHVAHTDYVTWTVHFTLHTHTGLHQHLVTL